MDYKEELKAIDSLRNDLIDKQRDLIYKILSENGGSISVNRDEDGDLDEDNNPSEEYTKIYGFGQGDYCEISKVSILSNEDKSFKIEGITTEWGVKISGIGYSDNYEDVLKFITQMIEYNNNNKE